MLQFESAHLDWERFLSLPCRDYTATRLDAHVASLVLRCLISKRTGTLGHG